MSDADVIVIGAGLSGLATARALTDAGVRVIVLEARDRVGGRTLSKQLGRATFDLGGQWLGARQPRLRALTDELGVETFPTYATGRKVLDLKGKRSTYAGTIPSLSPWALIDIERALRTLDWLSQRVPLDDPSSATRAAKWDARTVEDWMQKTMLSETGREIVRIALRVVFGAEPRDISLLHAMFYARAGKGLMSLVEIEDGAQKERFVLGAQELSIRLAKKLGDVVRLSHPVRAIHHGEHGVVVTTDVGELRATRAILALAPALAGRIVFTPDLPPLRDQLTSRHPMGATVKCVALYERSFWRDEGLSGEAVCSPGAVSVVFDNSSHDDAQASLLAFIVGQDAREWSSRTPESRRAEVLAAFARAFGPRALSPTMYIEQDWSTETWSRGCPVGVMGPGVWTSAGRALRAPIGPLHFAGTETATEWNGYLEGALQAAERVSREVLGALGRG